MTAILALARQRQDVHDFETSLVYIANSGQPGLHSKALSETKQQQTQNSGVTGGQGRAGDCCFSSETTAM